jgi:biopolymer transport protein TolR
MAMGTLSAGRGGRRRGRRTARQPMSEINVTPLVDVMLVLLIVFMVAAPLLTVGVPIELPKSSAKSLNTEQKPITISITSDGQVYLQNNPVQIDQLVDQVAALAQDSTSQRIYVRGDMKANYGSVMKVMGVLSAAGYSKIGLITAQDQTR